MLIKATNTDVTPTINKIPKRAKKLAWEQIAYKVMTVTMRIVMAKAIATIGSDICSSTEEQAKLIRYEKEAMNANSKSIFNGKFRALGLQNAATMDSISSTHGNTSTHLYCS